MAEELTTGFQRKWHGVPVWGWTAGGGAVAFVAYRWWRNRKTASTTSSTSTSTPGTTTQAIDSLAGQLQDLQGAGSTAGGYGYYGGGFGGFTTSTTTSTSTGKTTSTITPPATTSSSPPTNTGGSSSPPSSTSSAPPISTTPPPPPPPVNTGRLSAPTGVHLTIQGRTGVRLQWNSVSGANGYVCQNKRGGDNGTTVNGPFQVSSAVCNFGSLAPGTSYTALIWPSDASDAGGPGSNQPHVEFSFSTPS